MPWELLHVELGSDSPRGWGRDKEGLLSRWHGGQGVVTAGQPCLGALLCRGPESDRLCGLWVKESATNDNCYYCTICLHLVI